MKKYILLVVVVFIGCNCFGQKKEIHLFGITTDSSNYVKLSIDTCFLPDWIHLDHYADIETQINEIIKQSYNKGWNDRFLPDTYVKEDTILFYNLRTRLNTYKLKL